MDPFCDPVGWVESFGPVLGPILAALSVVAYPVYLIYQSLLLASATGQLAGAIVQGGVALAAIVYFVVAVVLLLVVAIAPCVPGFLDAATGGKVEVPTFFKTLYTYAWFITFVIGFVLYAILMAGHPNVRRQD